MVFKFDRGGTVPVSDAEVTIDLGTGRLYPVAEAAEQVLSFRPSPASLWRQAVKGVLTTVRRADGTLEERRVRLPTAKVSGRRVTTIEAFRAFVVATNPGLVGGDMDRSADRDAEVDAQLRAARVLSGG